MERILQDFQFACRALLKRPGFALAAIVTLGLGIGANVATFSVVNGILFKRLPGLEETRGLVEISRDLNGDFFDMSFPVIQVLREKTQILEDIAAFSAVPLAVGEGDEPSVHMALAVTGNYFDLLAVRPVAGRFFILEE